jgi:hypothetical protein
MHADAKQAIVAESKKLRVEVEAKVAKLTASADAQVKEAIAKFDGDMKDELANLKAKVKTQLTSTSVPAPADAPEQSESPQENAIPSTATRLEEDKKLIALLRWRFLRGK